jgi:hypothetical protein
MGGVPVVMNSYNKRSLTALRLVGIAAGLVLVLPTWLICVQTGIIHI